MENISTDIYLKQVKSYKTTYLVRFVLFSLITIMGVYLLLNSSKSNAYEETLSETTQSLNDILKESYRSLAMDEYFYFVDGCEEINEEIIKNRIKFREAKEKQTKFEQGIIQKLNSNVLNKISENRYQFKIKQYQIIVSYVLLVYGLIGLTYLLYTIGDFISSIKNPQYMANSLMCKETKKE